MNRSPQLAALAAIVFSLAACGGKPDSTVSAPQAGASSPPAVTGISTPSGVAVVTAKNAQ